MSDNEYYELMEEIRELRKDINAVGLALYTALKGYEPDHYDINDEENPIKLCKDYYKKKPF